jgi:flagellar biosynthesis/type III secretory pathway chaperone
MISSNEKSRSEPNPPVEFRRSFDEDAMEECLASVQELLEVLLEETRALKRFDSAALLKLVSAKTYLLDDLVRKLGAWKDQTANVTEHPKYLLLKECLADLEKKNQSNAVLIGETLAFYQDFLRCTCPPAYSQLQNHASSAKLEPPKGLTFRKEI